MNKTVLLANGKRCHEVDSNSFFFSISVLIGRFCTSTFLAHLQSFRRLALCFWRVRFVGTDSTSRRKTIQCVSEDSRVAYILKIQM